MMLMLLKSVYYQTLIFSRIKTAFFFIWVFPLFLFLIFGELWGSSPSYVPFILTGVIGMTITSDGLYSVGPVVKEYYANGLIKYLRKLPSGVFIYFLSYTISRVVSQLIVAAVLCFAAFVFFGYAVSLHMYLRIISAVLVGLILFAFLGLVLSSFEIKQSSINGFISIIGYTIIFTSDTFYPVGEMSASIAWIGKVLPLNSILSLMRESEVNYWNLILWTAIPMFAFICRMRKMYFKR